MVLQTNSMMCVVWLQTQSTEPIIVPHRVIGEIKLVHILIE